MTDYARYSLSFCASAKPGKISEAAFIKRLLFQTLATVWVRWSCYHQISANLQQQFCQIKLANYVDIFPSLAHLSNFPQKTEKNCLNGLPKLILH